MSTQPNSQNTLKFIKLLEDQWKTILCRIADLAMQGTQCFRLLDESSANLDLDVFGTDDGWCLFVYLKKPEQLNFFWSEVASGFSAISGKPVKLIGGALKEENTSRPLPLLWSMPGIAPVQWTTESGLKFRLEFENVLNPGLFMDQRENRQKLCEFIRTLPGSMLNLFSYTGAFSVAAASSGVETTSVDVSKRYLTWEKENHEKNGTLTLSKRVPEDSRKFLGRAARRIANNEMTPFRWIVLDPPTFSRSAGVIFRVEQELPTLIDACMTVLDTNGGILVSTNDRGWAAADFEKSVRAQASRMKMRYFRAETASDFRTKDYPLKSAWLLRNL